MSPKYLAILNFHAKHRTTIPKPGHAQAHFWQPGARMTLAIGGCGLRRFH
jgi:hypothetical protein